MNEGRPVHFGCFGAQPGASIERSMVMSPWAPYNLDELLLLDLPLWPRSPFEIDGDPLSESCRIG